MAQLTLRHSDFLPRLSRPIKAVLFRPAALRHAAEAEAGFLRDMPGHRLLRDALNDHAPPLTPGAVRQQPGQLPGVSPAPAAAVQDPAQLHGHIVIGVPDHIPRKAAVIHRQDQRLRCQPRPFQKGPGLLPGKGRLQIPHDLRVRQQPVQRLQVRLRHSAGPQSGRLTLHARLPYRSQSGREWLWTLLTMPMAANRVTMDEPP